MAIITGDGIVGKIREVFPHSAQVLAINDQSSGAGVILETTRTRGILRGNADGQPQIHLQAYTAMIDFGLDIQEAIESPRWLSGRFALGDARDLLNMEGRFPAHTVAELARRGHTINRWEDWSEFAGHANGITLDPTSGALRGGSDPRSDGAALGY